MKAVFIAYNQALTEKIDEILDELMIRGMTQWTEVKGRGSQTGEPHMGTHTWPAFNNTILAIVDNKKIEPLLGKLKELNEEVEDQGLRAFVWDIEYSI
jgi:nitrogen regulatory protein PII